MQQSIDESSYQRVLELIIIFKQALYSNDGFICHTMKHFIHYHVQITHQNNLSSTLHTWYFILCQLWDLNTRPSYLRLLVSTITS